MMICKADFEELFPDLFQSKDVLDAQHEAKAADAQPAKDNTGFASARDSCAHVKESNGRPVACK